MSKVTDKYPFVVPDTSSWSGPMDSRRHASNAAATILRLSNGAGANMRMDSLFDEYYAGLNALGHPLAAYHYGGSRHSGESQAQFCLDLLQDRNIQVVSWDFERRDNEMGSVYVDNTYRFLEKMEEHGKTGMLYTNIGLYNQFFSGKEWPKRWPLWISWPVIRPDWVLNPRLPKTVTEWAFWQYTWVGLGRLFGVNAAIDLNRFNGTKAELLDMFAVKGQPDPPPTTEPLTLQSLDKRVVELEEWRKTF